MPKKDEKGAQTVRYLEEKYPAIFQTHGLENELESLDAISLKEFLEQEQTSGYENDEKELERMYLVISHKKKMAVMININKEGKIPEGPIGIYYLEGHECEYEFRLTDEVLRKKVRESIKKYAKDTMTPQEEEKMIDQLVAQNLSQIPALMELDLKQSLEQEVRLLVEAKIDEKNHENGISQKKRKELEKGGKDNPKEQPLEQEEDTQVLPEDVVKAVMKLGITNIKGYFYTHPKQLSDKLDSIAVNENGGKVLILQVANGANPTGPDRYFGIQDENLMLYGTQDKEIEQLTQTSGVPPIDGKLIEPLKQKEPTYVEFSDTEGMLIEEKLKENMTLSIQDLVNYQKEIETLLEQYSKNVVAIERNELIEGQNKIKMLQENDENFNRLNETVAKKYGINFQNVQAISLQAKKYTNEVQEEVQEEWEEDLYDEHGVPQPPGKRLRGI